jgi:hypothetical protein
MAWQWSPHGADPRPFFWSRSLRAGRLLTEKVLISHASPLARWARELGCVTMPLVTDSNGGAA